MTCSAGSVFTGDTLKSILNIENDGVAWVFHDWLYNEHAFDVRPDGTQKLCQVQWDLAPADYPAGTELFVTPAMTANEQTTITISNNNLDLINRFMPGNVLVVMEEGVAKGPSFIIDRVDDTTNNKVHSLHIVRETPFVPPRVGDGAYTVHSFSRQLAKGLVVCSWDLTSSMEEPGVVVTGIPVHRNDRPPCAEAMGKRKHHA